ncbi:MAG TPA: (deoxy)nucleoside triphosphate pyrophosphohydrolase [Polyangia bacterium]|jgi:mutator protein MutT
MPPIRVVAAVASRRGRYLVCRRPPEKRHGGLWEFPGGKIQTGETAAAALRRELREELGVAVPRVGARLLSEADPGSAFVIEYYAVTLAGRLTPIEHSAIAWATPAELAELPLAPADRVFAATLAVRPATRRAPAARPARSTPRAARPPRRRSPA